MIKSQLLAILATIFGVLILIFSVLNFGPLVSNILAESPRFDRYEETDTLNDLRLMGKYDGDASDDVLIRKLFNISRSDSLLDNPSVCKSLNQVLRQESYPVSLPDIRALTIFSDERYLNYTAWFHPGFQNRLVTTDDSSPMLPLISIDIEPLESSNISLREYVDNLITKLEEQASNFRLLERTNDTLISDIHVEKIVYNATIFSTDIDVQYTKYLFIDGGNAYAITQDIPTEKYSKSINEILNSFRTGITGKNESSSTKNHLYEFLTGVTGKNESSSSSYKDSSKYYKDNFYNFSLYIPKGWTISKGNSLLGPDVSIFPIETIEEIGRQYQLTIDILQKNNEGGDFVERILWDYDTNSWTRLITERPGSYDRPMKVIGEQINFSNFYHNQTHSRAVDDLLKVKPPEYISSSIDLQSLGYPSKYGVIFTVTTIYKLGDNLCNVFDVIGPIPLPPPSFFINMNPRNLVLFPGEEGDVELNFTTTTPWDWSISFNSNPSDEFETDFGLNEAQLISDSELTTKISLKALPNATSDMHLIPVTASAQLEGVTLTLPSEIQGYPEDLSRTYNETEYLKVIVPDPLSPAQKFSNFVETWITPISGTWALFAGVAAVLAPVVFKIYKRRKKGDT